MKRFLPALLMVATAALVFLAHTTGDTSKDLLASGILNFGALVLLALFLLLRPHGVALVLARGVAVGIIGIIVFLWLVSGAPVNPARWFSSLETAITTLLLAVAVLLLRQLPLKDASAGRRVAKTSLGMVVMGFVYLALFYGGMIAGTLVEFVQLSPRVRADSVMRASVPRVQACAVAFAAEHGTYPASLAAMGPPPTGSGCLDDAHASGRVDAVTLSYIPASPDGTGRIDAYQVIARNPLGYEPGKVRMAFGDESGVIGVGDSVETPTALPLVHGAMQTLGAVRACAEFHRFTDSLDAYPRDSRTLFVRENRTSNEEKLRWLGCFPTHFPSFDSAYRMGNFATYTPLGDTARPADYVLHIRPRVYGVTGVRSIRATARGPVQATVENRPATGQDPIVPTCVYDRGDGRCAPEPGGVPARIRIIAADTIALGDTLRFEIVDPRPTDERRHPYQYHIHCNYQPYADSPEPPAAYSFATTGTCVPDAARTTDGGKMDVRVWVRDHSGAVTPFDRLVPIKGRSK